MYRPNFCSECVVKIVRLRWYLWTSSQFCDSCARLRRKQRLTRPAVAVVALLGIGLLAGRAGRPVAPPLLIQRSANSPLYQSPESTTEVTKEGKSSVPANTPPAIVEEVVYICGALTKKGTPCSRRVHGPVRCWQHVGMQAMLPAEKLKVK